MLDIGTAWMWSDIIFGKWFLWLRWFNWQWVIWNSWFSQITCIEERFGSSFINSLPINTSQPHTYVHFNYHSSIVICTHYENVRQQANKKMWANPKPHQKMLQLQYLSEIIMIYLYVRLDYSLVQSSSSISRLNI